MVSRKNEKPKLQANYFPSDPSKLPPQAVDLEEAVLGAVMLEKDAIIVVSEILKPESFYKEIHGEIYRAAIELSLDHQPIDILTVTDRLKKRNSLEQIGGAAYLSGLTLRVASSAHIEYHARIIQQKYIQRELIRVASEIQQKSYDEAMDVEDLLNESEMALFEITQSNIKKETQSIDVLLREAIGRIEKLSREENAFSGIPSGYTRLDRVTSGWQASDLIILAARPSMGKTAFALSMTRRMAIDHQKHVAIFSLEMSAMQLVNRFIVSETELMADKIRTGRLEPYEWEQLEHRIKRLQQASIYIDDTPSISVFELRAKCRRLKQKGELDIVIIDYLQLMTCTSDTRGNREQEVSIISRSLKAIARELEVPVIALSQLNRGVETRSGLASKRPQLSDLRESGAIEQDADLVLFIHRPEKYGFSEDEDGNSLIGIAELIIAKHRNGALDDIRLRFRGELARFDELDMGVSGDFPHGEDGHAPRAIIYGSKMNAPEGNGSGLEPMGANVSFDDNPPF